MPLSAVPVGMAAGVGQLRIGLALVTTNSRAAGGTVVAGRIVGVKATSSCGCRRRGLHRRRQVARFVSVDIGSGHNNLVIGAKAKSHDDYVAVVRQGDAHQRSGGIRRYLVTIQPVSPRIASATLRVGVVGRSHHGLIAKSPPAFRFQALMSTVSVTALPVE